MPVGRTGLLRAELVRILRSRPFALRFWDGTLVPARNGEGPVFALRSPPVVACALRAPGQLGIAPAVVASLGCAGPRSVADRPSEPAFSRVAAEITRYLIGVDARAQPADAFVFEDRPAMDGILKSFERRLQMLDPRLERLQSVLQTDLWRRVAGSRPTATAPPHSTHTLCDRDHARPYRLRAWRSLGVDLSLHRSAAPDPLMGWRARAKRGGPNHGRDRRLAPQVSLMCLKLGAPGAITLRWASGSR